MNHVSSSQYFDLAIGAFIDDVTIGGGGSSAGDGFRGVSSFPRIVKFALLVRTGVNGKSLERFKNSYEGTSKIIRELYIFGC